MKEFIKLFFETLFKEKEEISLDKHPLVDIKILRKIDYKRYEIAVKKRKMVCVSHIDFDIGANYWGKIYKDRYGSITISNLKKEPKIFQSIQFDSFFMPFSDILESLKEPKKYIKIVKQQTHLQNITSFIYCYDNGVLSFPLCIDNEIMLLQFKPNKNENRIEYYFAFKNYGEFKGILDNNRTTIETNNSSFLKSLGAIETDSVTPLCELEVSILNIKG